MALGRLLQMIALAIAVLSGVTTAIKINLVNRLSEAVIYGSNAATGRNHQVVLDKQQNITMNMQADWATVTMRRDGEYSGPALNFQYRQVNGEITYKLNSTDDDPLKHYRRRVIPSDSNCPHMWCSEGGTRCASSTDHPNQVLSCGGTSEFTIILADPKDHYHHWFGPPYPHIPHVPHQLSSKKHHAPTQSSTKRVPSSTKRVPSSTKRPHNSPTKRPHHSPTRTLRDPVHYTTNAAVTTA